MRACFGPANKTILIMRKGITTLIILLMAVGLFAQQRGVAPLAKGEKQVNFGLGFSNYGLPVYASVDFAVHKDVTLTPQVNVKFDDNVRFGLLFKADYHWNYLMGIPSNWDFYTGGRAGLDFEDAFFLDLGIQIGGRWYWSDRWGLNLELAGGTGFGSTLGLSVKL